MKDHHVEKVFSAKNAPQTITPDIRESLAITGTVLLLALDWAQHRTRQVNPRTQQLGSKQAIAALAGLLLLSLATAGCGGSSINRGLWVANAANVVEFTPAQLMQGTVGQAPHLAINSAVFASPQGVVFDAAGNLWVIDGGTAFPGTGTATSALFEFTPAQLKMLATANKPMPNVTIQSAAFKFPQQAVFDAQGNMWVSDFGSNAVFVFTPAQLAMGGANVTPDRTVTSNPAFNGSLGIAFDPAGDLFIANNNTTTIFEFNANTLPTKTATTTLVPNVVLSDNGKGSIQAPWALAFDSMGNLFFSNANAPFTLNEFPKASLTMTGSPTPTFTISPTMANGSSTLAAPNGIAFDNIGGLSAISSNAPFGVARFSQLQLMQSGPTLPSSFIVGNATTLDAPAGATFGPVVN
jgi:streptogramin lyase